MKKHLYILLSLFWIVGCTTIDLENDKTEESQDVLFTFNVNIPEVEISKTKGKDQVTGCNTLNLLIFDQNGLFLSRYTATLTGSGSGSSYSVRMVTSTQPRIIHFVANYDFSSFSDVANLYASESTLIPSFNLKDEVGYWQRISLPGGISSATFPASVSLIRNISKVTVAPNSTSATYPKLNNIRFAIGNALEYGSVAPFDASSGAFTEGVVTEVPGSSLLPLSAFTQQETDAQYLYERKNASAPNPAYVIVKGDYVASAGATPKTCYYKVDFVLKNTTTLLNILRNYHYSFTIERVAMEGYSTALAAAQSPASNNVVASVVLQPLLTISDGTAVLGVGQTNLILTKTNQPFSITYAYFPNGTTLGYNNIGASVILTNDDPANPVLPSISATYTSNIAPNNQPPSVITGTTGLMPRALLATGKITVSKLGLVRTINVQFRYPYTMSMPYFTPNPVALAQNMPVELNFTIPNTVPSIQFPMTFNILASNLSPDNSKNTIPVVIIDKKYYYQYTATQAGPQKLYFLTNSANSTGQVVISGNLYSDAVVNLTASSSAVKTFISWLHIKPKIMYNQSQIILYLQLPAGSATSASPLDVVINTTSLVRDPNNLSTGEMVNVSPVAGGFKYRATTSGSLVPLYFYTSQDNAAESITLTASGFVTSQNLNQ